MNKIERLFLIFAAVAACIRLAPSVEARHSTEKFEELPLDKSKRFVSALWCERKNRLEMFHDLVANHPLVHLDKGQLIKLLGNPDAEPLNSPPPNQNAEPILRYDLDVNLWMDLVPYKGKFRLRLGTVTNQPVFGAWFPVSSEESTIPISERERLQKCLIRDDIETGLSAAFSNPGEPFNKRSWSWSATFRSKCLYDLVHSNSLLGKSREHVHSLLGPPDPIPWSQNELIILGNGVESDFYKLIKFRDPNVCGPLFEIAYKNDFVSRCRVIFRRSRTVYSSGFAF